MVGAEVIYGMQKAVKAFEKSGKVKILVDSKVVRLLTEGKQVVGVEYESLATSDINPENQRRLQLRAHNVILATGGFAADRSPDSLLSQYRPELVNMATTAGEFSTGDGVLMATTLGAAMVDMDKIQIHPTGWVDPADPGRKSKILAAELMRGVGGILLNKLGKR
jgi:succinate dehydrogenase/fumarate reductase flavoprotein subunit